MNLKELGLKKISFHSRNKLDNIIAKEGDSGTRGLLVEFEKGLDCRLYLNDDTVIANEVEEGLYELIFPNDLKEGIVEAEIKFYEGKEISSSFIFDIRVMRNLFNMKNGIIVVKEGRFDEKIETKVEYYDEFERMGYPFGRNLLTNTSLTDGLDRWLWSGNSDDVSIDGNVISKKNSIGESYPRLYQESVRDFTWILDDNYILSFESKVSSEREQSIDIADSNNSNRTFSDKAYHTEEWSFHNFHWKHEVPVSPNVRLAFWVNSHKSEDINELHLRRVQILHQNESHLYSPAPEDLSNRKCKRYNLSTKLKKDQYYTLSVDGNFNEDDFIGVFLGNNKFIGYLQDNKITFKSNIDIDDDCIVVKSLGEEGIINSLSIKEVEQ